MNPAYWHLLLNHFPITGTYFGTIILITGMLLKNETVKNTGFCLFVLTALLAIPVLYTGDGAKDILTSIGQKNEYFIHRHENLAENAFWLSISIGIFSLGALLGRKNIKQTQIMTVMVMIAGLINVLLMTEAGNAGGQIRHTEIRPVNSVQNETEEK